MDVGPTPYFIRIYSVPVGGPSTIVASCGFGTTCTVSVTQATIQNQMLFQALIQDSAGTTVPIDISFGDNFTFVTWHGSGVTLLASRPTAPVGSAVTLTTTTAYDITTSPFAVELFDDTTGAGLKVCGFGTTCSTTVSQSAATTHAYRACFSGVGPRYPPPSVLECAAVQYVTWSNSGSSVSLTAPAKSRGWETVTATASFDVGPTPYFIQVYDIVTGRRITSCGTGTTCTTTTFTPSASGNTLVAFIAQASTTPPPPLAVAQSATVYTMLDTSPE
jgi:hypothetical protein